MKRTLVATATLALTTLAAHAQSSVTLGGILKEGVANTRFSNAPAPAVNGSNTALIDSGSSRILISGTEDLGGGLAAFFQIDSRFRMDDGTAGASRLGSGNTFIGLRGGWGAFQAGQMDTHYCTSVNDDIAGNGTAIALQASSCALQGFVNGSGGAGRSIAVTSRSQNTLRYVTPNLSGFTGQVSYSFNPYGSERSVAATTPRGSAAQLGLNYDQGPLAVRFSYYRHTANGGTVATTGDNAATGTAASQRAYTLGAGWDFGIAKVGLTYDRSELRDLTAAASPSVAGVGTAQRTTWILPVTVPLGTGSLIASYARASDTKLGTGATVASSGARHLSVGYNYPLSKRTSVGVSITRLDNGSAGVYQLYTNSSFGNSGTPVVAAGQDQRLTYVGIRHVF
ncbi:MULTISPECIES: porin [Ramlibacter]|uniref:Porin n=1 Tax=Ramlibacter pinisoli TaxID=2682844 RepID=A0A6N8J370_9BURK|nr:MULTISPECIES: porin [Ramlibacter]MBA2962827.1 porin [Ramlibacter sp. CGMCC 1.13660]MVQ32770.1 porin [Ramlibacter pinisoli]